MDACFLLHIDRKSCNLKLLITRSHKADISKTQPKKKTFFFFPSTKPPSNKHNIQASASHFITQLIGINKHVIHHRLVSWLLWKISKVCRQQDEAQDQKIDKGEKENGSGEEICEMGSKTWKYGNMGLHVGSAVSHMKRPQSQNKSNPIYLWISYLETIQ